MKIVQVLGSGVLALTALCAAGGAQAQMTPVGLWKTIDDDGKSPNVAEGPRRGRPRARRAGRSARGPPALRLAPCVYTTALAGVFVGASLARARSAPPPSATARAAPRIPLFDSSRRPSAIAPAWSGKRV